MKKKIFMSFFWEVKNSEKIYIIIVFFLKLVIYGGWLAGILLSLAIIFFTSFHSFYPMFFSINIMEKVYWGVSLFGITMGLYLIHKNHIKFWMSSKMILLHNGDKGLDYFFIKPSILPVQLMSNPQKHIRNTYETKIINKLEDAIRRDKKIYIFIPNKNIDTLIINSELFSSVKMEKLEKTDYKAVLEIQRKNNMLPHQRENWKQTEEKSIRMFTDTFEKAINDNLAYALKIEKEVIGHFLLAEKKENILHIKELGISPRYHRQGFGTKCLAYIESIARERKYMGISLTVYKDNPAQHLYMRKSFEIVGEKLEDTAYMMEKKL